MLHNTWQYICVTDMVGSNRTLAVRVKLEAF